eukprot:2389944-Karenia_brevis.AAC.1
MLNKKSAHVLPGPVPLAAAAILSVPLTLNQLEEQVSLIIASTCLSGTICSNNVGCSSNLAKGSCSAA